MPGLLPAVVIALLAYAVRPVGAVVGPLRLAAVRATVIVAAAAILGVEALSALHALTPGPVIVAWSAAVAVALAAAVLRWRRDGMPRPDPLGWWRGAGRGERAAAIAVVVLALGELVLALASPPNNYDSQTYHLPRIEHWVAQRDLAFYQTEIYRQLAMAPGAEYLLLHLRLLTGGDGLYNLVQWSAGAGSALVASRIAGQLGGGRRAQLLTAFAVATTPLVALEASSTQTDLVVAAWVACAATLVLDQVRQRARLGGALLIGATVGLVYLTKATGMLAVGVLLIVWGIAQLRLAGRWRGVPGTVGHAALIVVVAAAIAGPYVARMTTTYGDPLGPPGLRGSISMQRHDPAAIAVNALRIGQSALNIPILPVNDAAAAGIEGLSRAMGVDPDDPAITFPHSTFPFLTIALDEDRAAFPITGTLVLLAAAFLLVRPAKRVPVGHAATARAYAAVFWATLLLHVATIKWQPWGNRLVLYLLVLGAPLVGLWLDAVLRAAPRGRVRIKATAITAALTITAGAACAAVAYGTPRRLVGPGSVFTTSDLRARFARRPQWQADYEWAAAGVREAGARRVGLVQGNDTWEYEWWLLLPHVELVGLQPKQPLPTAHPRDMDAILCVASRATCESYLPRGWHLHYRNNVLGYALP